MNKRKAAALVRGHILHTPAGKLESIYDGALLLDADGYIIEKQTFADLHARYPGLAVKDFSSCILLPSFFDTHIHFPQLDMVGSCAEELLLWLDNYTFPAEAAFRGKTAFVEAAARNFVQELRSNGTSCAVVYSSSCGEATDLLFEVMEESGLRAIIGKTSMDRHCPQEIAVPVKQDMKWTESLIKRWHGKDNRLFYALTPRFAPSCSDELMAELSQLYAADASLYLQTHYAENKKELAWIAELYPEAKHYLDVYHTRGMLRDKTILAHAIHVSPEEEKILLAEKINISHCPSSNLFLGSGLFRARQFLDQGQRISLGTDVGAGTSFSLWQTMNEAYKVAQLLQEQVSPTELFSMATVEAASSLGFSKLGCLDPGYMADFQVIDPRRRPLLARRMENARSAEDILAALIHFADDRTLQALFVQGERVYVNSEQNPS